MLGLPAAGVVGHWPIRQPGNNTSKPFNYLACKLCRRKKQRRETSFRCKGCPGMPPLCPNCFEEWHLAINYN